MREKKRVKKKQQKKEKRNRWMHVNCYCRNEAETKQETEIRKVNLWTKLSHLLNILVHLYHKQ